MSTLERLADHRKRWRQDQGYNFAQAAKALGLTLREYAMQECGVTTDMLATGNYPSTVNVTTANRRSADPS